MRALAVVALLCAAAPALADGDDAQEKAQARALLAQGNTLFEKGDLKGALVVFRAAYAVYPSAKLLVNVAAAERELGDLAGAASDLRHFLDEADDDPFLVDKARSDLKALERRVGRITLQRWPPRTTLEVDGRASRDPAYVKPGGHVVRVRPPQGEPIDREIDVAAGETADVPWLFVATPPPARAPVAARKTRWWIPVTIVVGVLVVGGAIGLGIGLTQSSSTTPLRSDLGIFKFSDFH